MWGLNWGKGTGTWAETGVVDKTGIIWFTPPFRVTTAIMGEGRGKGMVCLILDKVSVVHLGCQVMRPLHVPQKQFGHLLRW